MEEFSPNIETVDDHSDEDNGEDGECLRRFLGFKIWSYLFCCFEKEIIYCDTEIYSDLLNIVGIF